MGAPPGFSRVRKRLNINAEPDPPPPPPPPPAPEPAPYIPEPPTPSVDVAVQPLPNEEPLNPVSPSSTPFWKELHSDPDFNKWFEQKYLNGEADDVVTVPETTPTPEDEIDLNLEKFSSLTTCDVARECDYPSPSEDDHDAPQDDGEPTSPPPKLVGAGVANLGNTCFMGSILQCFTHTVLLVQGLHSCTHDTPCGVDGFCVICALREHIDTSLASSVSVVSPDYLVDNLSSSFERYQQEDAHEFMQLALNKLQRCFPGGEDNLVGKIFGGRLISKLRCCNCGHYSETYEAMIDMSLQIENIDTLQQALESFTNVEKIDAKLKCDSCKEDVSKEKQLLLDQTPSVAAFHLKRFKRAGNSVQKISSHVHFTLDLDLQPYTSDKGNDNVLLKYDLYAIVVHIGDSPDSGHYYCLVRSAPDMWYELNDTEVSSVPIDIVMSQEAYILFYAQQGTLWFSSIMEGAKLVLENKGDCGDEQKDYDSTEASDECVADSREESDASISSI